MVVAPAVMTLLGDRAWWFPAWLDRLLPRIELEGEVAAAAPSEARPRNRRPPRLASGHPAPADAEG
jgi:RND superfamily putative drug exporter